MELKSNFHDREWIMNEVKKKYETAVAYFGSEDFVIGAFLVGSQNYNLDIESSDVDVKIYVLPSLESINLIPSSNSSSLILSAVAKSFLFLASFLSSILFKI